MNANDPAYPGSIIDTNMAGQTQKVQNWTGLTKRELVAAMVLGHVAAMHGFVLGTGTEAIYPAEHSVRLADALLAALQRTDK